MAIKQNRARGLIPNSAALLCCIVLTQTAVASESTPSNSGKGYVTHAESSFASTEEGKALLYLLWPPRDPVLNLVAKPVPIMLDKSPIGILPSRSYLYTTIDPGVQTLWLHQRKMAPLRFDFEAGKVYVVLLNVFTRYVGTATTTVYEFTLDEDPSLVRDRVRDWNLAYTTVSPSGQDLLRGLGEIEEKYAELLKDVGKQSDEPLRAAELTPAKLPRTFKKVWYRPAKKGWLRAYSASGTLTVQEDSVQFTSKKINFDLKGEELHRLEWGGMKGDFVNEWAILRYKTDGVESTAGFKDGSKLGWGGNTKPIYDALKAAMGPDFEKETLAASSPAKGSETPFEWNPGYTSPGTSLSVEVLETMSGPPKGMVRISIRSSGFGESADSLALWQKTGSQFSRYRPGITTDGTVQLLPGVDESILGGYILGQPFDITLVDEDTSKRAHAKLVPFLISAQADGGCHATADVQTQSGLVWAIYLAGYETGEPVNITSAAKKETLTVDVTASETGEITFPILYPKRSRGKAKVTAIGKHGCRVSLEFAIGKSALKAK